MQDLYRLKTIFYIYIQFTMRWNILILLHSIYLPTLTSHAHFVSHFKIVLLSWTVFRIDCMRFTCSIWKYWLFTSCLSCDAPGSCLSFKVSSVFMEKSPHKNWPQTDQLSRCSPYPSIYFSSASLSQTIACSLKCDPYLLIKTIPNRPVYR